MPLELVGDRVTIRAPRSDDARRMADLADDPGIARFTTMPSPFTIEDARSFLDSLERKKGSEDFFVIALDDELIGMLAMADLAGTNHSVEIAFWMGAPYRGNGYVGEALDLLIAYLFEDLGIERVWAQSAVSNAAAHRLLENRGFVREGVMRSHMQVRGVRHDVVIYGLLREDP